MVNMDHSLKLKKNKRMKNYKEISYFLFLILILTNSKCKEEVIKPPPNINPYFKPSFLDTIWRSYIGGFSNNPILNSNNDILMSKTYGNSQGEIFKLFDGATGKLKWEWADYFKPEEYFNDESHSVIKDVLVLCARNNTYALDMLTGKTIWKNKMDSISGSPQIYKDEDGYIYHGFSSKTQASTYYIFRTKYNEGNWELVCTFKDTLIVDRVIGTSIACSKNNKGEKIMVFTLYMDFTINGERGINIKSCGYNLITKNYEWEKDYTNRFYEFSVCNMHSAEGKVFTFANYSGNWYIVAINASDGSIVWDKVLPDFGVSMHLYKDNIVVLSNGSSKVLCLNQNTGTVVWETPFVYHNDASYPNMNFAFGDANVFKNYLFSTQGSNLLVLNLENGNIVFNKQVALPSGFLRDGVAINEQKRWFYVGDQVSVVCYKLPDEVKY
jgi:outer membrane protein assembly factor BamB